MRGIAFAATPNAARAPARALSGPAGSHWCHRASGSAARSSWLWRAAQARRMERVPLDFRGPAHVALDEQSRREPGESHRGREEERLARHDLLRLPDVRDDLLVRLSGAGGHTRERERRTHELEEVTTIEPFWQPRCVPPLRPGRRMNRQPDRGPIREDGRLLHRWHVEQLVKTMSSRMSYSRLRRSPRTACSIGGRQPIVKTSSFGRRYRSGWRWHSRHHFIWREEA